MTVVPLHPHLASLAASSPCPEPFADPGSEARRALADLLAGENAECELPALPELLGALLALAEGSRRKVLLPLSSSPAEWALLRRGKSALVSYYHTDASPEIVVLDRRIPLRALVDACADALAPTLAATPLDRQDDWGREVSRRLVERAASTSIASDGDVGLSARKRVGGALEDPGERHPLAFGYEAAIFPSGDAPREGSSHADVHAMLFPGALYVWVRGRRIPLARGPILLVVSRMVAAMRALVEAWEEERPVNVRLRTGGFVVGVRRERSGEVALTLGSDEEGIVTIPALDVPSASLPVLRVAGDLVRAVVAVDRSQARNLRISALRDEVRRLRRRVRTRQRAEPLVHADPDLLRASALPEETPNASLPPAPGHLRFTARWTAAIDGLDAATTYLAGERLVLSTPRRALAMSREDGHVLWQREGEAATSFLGGRTLVRISTDGVVEMHELERGDVVFRTRVSPRIGGPTTGLFAGGDSVPPVAIVTEGRDRLAAIDLRTGELRWRFAARGASELRLRRAGRLLLVCGGDASVHAIDLASGELAWRHADSGRFCLPPALEGDTVLALSGEPGRGEAVLVGLDLFSGAERFRRDLGAPALCAPVAARGRLIVALAGPRRGVLASCSPEDGSLQWMVQDPGMGVGGASLALDKTLILNAPSGRVSSIELASGRTVWSRDLAHPVSDDVPRRLTPTLRGGALFVPSASVHVLSPSDGESIGESLPTELVPDAMRVDERGWVYVAEESGHIAALAPAPHLVLVRG